jgi:hypothetical protein
MKTAALGLLFLLLQAEEARRDPWAGFGVGSWVVFSRKTTSGGTTTERKDKSVIVAVDQDLPTREIQQEKDGKFEPSTARSRHAPGVLAEKEMKAGASRPEELSIGSRKISCTVTEYHHEDNVVTAKLTVWKCPDVKIPYRELAKDGPDIALLPDVVQLDFSFERETRKEHDRVRVIGLDEKVKVGDREIPCVLEEWSVEEERGGEGRTLKSRRWLSDSVPGRVVRFEASLKGPKTMDVVQQAVDFEVKR